MRKLAVLIASASLIGAGQAAAQNTWAGNSAADYADEQNACYTDAYRFCGGNTVFIFEMENCLKEHLGQLSRPCRKLLSPTDFRKYYREEAHPFGFLD
ncbi:hypothetical protein [Methylocystis sp. S23]